MSGDYTLFAVSLNNLKVFFFNFVYINIKSESKL